MLCSVLIFIICITIMCYLASETHELSESSQADKARHDELLKQLEAKKRARAITVPTNDNLVKKKLREMGEPITLFGERVSR